MLISLEHKFVLLANTKCGSTSLVHSLAPHVDISFADDFRLRHTSLAAYRAHFLPYLRGQVGDVADALEVFGILREPLDWLGSWYRFRARAELADPAHPRHGEYTGDMSWEAFLDHYIATPWERRPEGARIADQNEFYADTAGKVQGITLYPYASLQLLFNRLCARIGKEVKLLEWNVSPSVPLPTSKHHREILDIALYDDFALYRRLAETGTRFP